MRITIVQMRVQDGEPAVNLAHAEGLIRSEPGADLYLLPEVWTTGYAFDSWPDYVSRHHETVMERLVKLARESGSWIGGSYVVNQHGSSFSNRFILISPDLVTPISYDKVHLFSPLQEDRRFVAGNKRVDTMIGDWKVNLSICYDLRFPEMYRASAVEGSTLFLVVSQWPKVRCHHMVALAKARAIENLAFVAVCNRIGQSKQGLEFGGQSGIWGPDGSQSADAGNEEGVISADIDLELVRNWRKDFPALQSRVEGVDY